MKTHRSQTSTMVTTKRITPKSLQFKMKQDSNNGGESSFRVLYYGDASAGSIPFMWESQPGTPKHAHTESSLRPLTPPPAYHPLGTKYSSSKKPTSLRTLFPSKSYKNIHVATHPPKSTSDSSISSHDSSLKLSTSLRSLFQDSSSRKGQVGPVGDSEEGGSSTSTLCFGGGLKKVNRLKKVLMSIRSHGKAHTIK